MWVRPLGGEDPLEEEMAMHSSILAWKICRQRNLAGHSPWSQEESDTTEHTGKDRQKDWNPGHQTPNTGMPSHFIPW